MKEHRVLSQRQEIAAEDELFRTLLELESVDEYRAFFQDLCTPAELQAMKDRWSVVERLEQGSSYRAIHDETGVSVTTIGRVARCLMGGVGGYRKALDRVLDKREAKLK